MINVHFWYGAELLGVQLKTEDEAKKLASDWNCNRAPFEDPDRYLSFSDPQTGFNLYPVLNSDFIDVVEKFSDNESHEWLTVEDIINRDLARAEDGPQPLTQFVSDYDYLPLPGNPEIKYYDLPGGDEIPF